MPNTSPIRLIVGLGNPGADYAGTRHNAGYDFLDLVAKEAKISFREEMKFFGLLAKLHTEDGDLWLLKPTTFMNASGSAVQAISSYYKIAPEEILVAHDELDLPPGTMKIKLGGGNAGHNGLKDITEKLSTPNFWRLRFGIGHPRVFCPQMQVYDWVLGRASAEHREGLETCLKAALKTVNNLAAGKMQSVERTIMKFARPPKEKEKPQTEKETS